MSVLRAPLWLVLLGVGTFPPRAALAQGIESAFGLSTGLEVDTNPAREFVTPGFGGPRPDAAAAVTASAQLSKRLEGVALSGDYSLAARKFLGTPGGDLALQTASIQLGAQPLRRLTLGVGLDARDRRMVARSYSDLAGQLFARFRPEQGFELQLGVNLRRFVYWPEPGYSFTTPTGTAAAKVRVGRRHQIQLRAEAGRRRFVMAANPRPPDSPTGERRSDAVLGMEAGYDYRGPVAVSVGYGYFEQASNSFAESARWHRVRAALGLALPASVYLLAQATVQLAHYPDGLFLSPEVSLTQDDERHQQLSVSLARPVSERVDLELTGSLFRNALPQNALIYERALVHFGLVARFD